MGYWRENLNRHEPTIRYPPPPYPFQTLMSAFNGIMNDTGNFQKENNDSRQGFDATNKKIFEDFDPTWREAPLMTAQPSLLLPRLCKRERPRLLKKACCIIWRNSFTKYHKWYN